MLPYYDSNNITCYNTIVTTKIQKGRIKKQPRKLPGAAAPKEYKSRESKLYSTVYLRVYRQTKVFYESLIGNSHRKPFVKSKYFDTKVFLDEFWAVILRRNLADRRLRLAFYLCAIDLIRNSKCAPHEKYDSGRTLYEFYGIAKNGERFVVHIRRGKNGLYFMSCFPK